MPGTHLPNADPDDCPPDCRGCGQAEADHGLRLCRVCTRRISHDAWRLAWYYTALQHTLTGSGQHGGGEYLGTITREPGLDLREPGLETRDNIRTTLVGLVRLIAEERGINLPWHWHVEQLPAGFIGPARRTPRGDNTAQGFAAYITRHATWLAAHTAAGEHAEQLRDAALDERTFRLAFPTPPGRGAAIGQCPIQVETGQCSTRLIAQAGADQVVCRGCGTTDTITGWRHRIVGQPVMWGRVTAYAAAQHLAHLWHRDVTPEIIRKWGQRSTRTGVEPARKVSLRKGERGDLVRDPHGRALYDWDQLEVYADRIWRDHQAHAEENPAA